MNNINVFYHFPCSDGEFAKIVWQMKYPNSIFHKWNYGKMEESLNILNTIDKPSKIVFLDCCPNITLLPIEHTYIIIDHHENAINTMIQSELYNQYNINIFNSILKSGCMLTWEYCHNNTEYPLILKHIGNKDIWNFSDIDTEPYCIGFNEYLNSNIDVSRLFIINRLLKSDKVKLHEQFITLGNKIIEENKIKAIIYFNNMTLNNEYIDNIYYNIIDIECSDSSMYKYLIDYASITYNSCDVLRILHTIKEDRKIYSVRSLKDNVTVDNIARKYGGNGHVKAAGYTILL